MQAHQLDTIKRQSRKRIGRGGRRGTYSGRGMKGQKSRSGGNVDPLFEGGRSSLLDRLKKNRGFTSPHPKKKVLSLDVLEKAFASGETVSVRSLEEKKIVTAKGRKVGVKILNSGTIQKKLTIEEGILLSEGAAKAIEKAGGTIKR